MTESQFVSLDWPAPVTVHAVITTRIGGSSAKPYDSFNLATHVGDDPLVIAANRARLHEALKLPAEPLWLRQVHGVTVVDAAAGKAETEADGSFATRPGVVCAVDRKSVV